MNGDQLLRLVVRPTLAGLGARFATSAAERLVLGTLAHESGGFKHIRQVLAGGRDGEGRGFGQVERATLADLYRNFLAFRPDLLDRLDQFLAPAPAAEDQLATNLAYGVAVCRLVYFRVPAALPEADDLADLAAYWKAHYNTYLGAGTVEKWLGDYDRHVAPIYAAERARR